MTSNLFSSTSLRVFILTASLSVAGPLLRAQEVAENIIVNGGFEQWVPATMSQLEDKKGKEFQCAALEEGLVPESYDVISERAGDPPAVSVVRDPADKHSGEYSVRMSSPSTDQIGSIYSTQMSIMPQTKYKLSLWYKLDGVSGNGIRFWIAQGRSQDFYGTSKSVLFKPQISTGMTDWTLFETIFEPTEDGDRINFCLQLQGSSGTVWFDDVVITPATEADLAAPATPPAS